MMRTMDMPLDTGDGAGQSFHFVIDPVTLRELANNVELAENRIVELEVAGESGDAERISWLRILGRLGEAEDLGWRTLVKRGGAMEGQQPRNPLPYPAVTAALRLAHVLHWQERYDKAEQLFVLARKSAASAASDSSNSRATALTLVAFAHQHLGKAYFDQGMLEEALDCFQCALSLRQDLACPPDQIISTCQAIARTKTLIAERGIRS